MLVCAHARTRMCKNQTSAVILTVHFLNMQVTLNLSNNRLKYFPDDISQLSGLQELFLQYNQLSALPVCNKYGI